MNPEYETCPELGKQPGVKHGFFGRDCDVSPATAGARGAEANRAAACRALELPPDRLALVRQVHSNRVLTLDRPPDPSTEADGMVTDRPDLPLGIITADCAPVLLADAERGVIGAAHAGWRGAVGGIIGNVVGAMVGLGARLDRIVAGIGPTISFDSYEVGPDFVEELKAHDPEGLRRLRRTPDGKTHFDLPGFVFDQLRAAGVGLAEDLGICTYANAERFFSHRRATHEGGRAGRQIAVIGRK